jgi:dipeptidyl aminopeptidase/acylaminoacyl peptidase
VWIRIVFSALLSLLILAAPALGAYPGRNGKIAFYTQRDRLPNAEIYAMNPDGSDQVNLTRHPFADYQPRWSPDGSKIAFLSERDGCCGNTEIYTMNADGSGQQRLTVNPGRETFPTWSPDGTRMAFDRDGDIHVMNSTGSGDVVLLGGPTRDVQPAWSPDGSKIAFTSAPQRDANGDVYVMDSDGTDLVNLTNHPANDIEPDWSPDGSHIAFVSSRESPTNFDIWVMRSDGTEQVRLTTTPAPYDDDITPAWSPDGTKISFASEGGEIGRDIYVMNSDGSDSVNIAHDPTVADGPSWQPLQNRAPDCSTVTASPAQLAPPNRRLVRVRLSGATDADGDVVALMITGVTQDELVGNLPDAVARPEPDQVRLRAERDGSGDGRVYRISFDGRDGHGGTCTGTVTVSVKKGARPAVDSAPPSFDSFG